jgi:DNA primase
MGSSGYKHDAVCYIAGTASTCIVCEGPMDALAAASLGYRAIAILGAAPPPVVFDHVARLAGKRAVIIPDMDRVAAWQLVQQQLGQRGVIGTLRAIHAYKDLAAMPPDERREFLGTQDEGRA